MRHGCETVAIVGCGIAGPVLALFLKRIGIEAVIFERRGRAAVDDGAFLGVAPNGMNVLAEIGLRREVEAISVPCRGFEFRNARGEVIGTIDRRRDVERFGAELRMVRRGDLHRVLTDAARGHGVQVEFDRALIDVDRRDASRVAATFADGRRVTADALIGCDGINSTTRQIVLPHSPRPAFTGLLDFAGFARSGGDALETGVNVMVFGRRAFFGAFRTPSGEVWWFHNGGAAEPAAGTRAPAALCAHILDLHRDDPPWIGEIVASTPDILGPYALHDILSMPRWHEGRVCLAGDAAHATTPSAGQGASLALEDAMVLAQCLRDIPDPVCAFAAFERARRARVETIVKQSRRTGSTKAVSGPVAEWFRDCLLPLFLRIGTRAQEQHYAYRLHWEHAYASF